VANSPFDVAVTAFGPLPEDVRLKLAKELENAWRLSQNFGFDPAKARVVFQRIAVAAENLLGTLFIGPDDISRAFDERVELGTALGPLRMAKRVSSSDAAPLVSSLLATIRRARAGKRDSKMRRE
jgi:hypothetical protein